MQFENHQDTTLLRNAFLSVYNTYSSQEERNKLNKAAIETISSTIISLTRDLPSCRNKKYLTKQVGIHRRCHSAVFFLALRFCNITCPEADKYYEVIVNTYPSINLNTYVRISHHCDWSQYFLESIQQIQPDIVVMIVKKIMGLKFEDENMTFYSWHLAIQALIWKLFMVEDPNLGDSQTISDFSFPFEYTKSKIRPSDCENDSEKTGSFHRSLLLHGLISISKCLRRTACTSPNNIEFKKLILHGYKTVFELLTKISTCSTDYLKELFRMNKLLKQCIRGEIITENIQSEMNNCKKDVVDQSYLMCSWEIDLNYLILLIVNFWDSYLEDDKDFLAFLKPHLPKLEMKKALMNLSPVFESQFGSDSEIPINLLKTIIQYNYSAAPRAAKILLSHPEIREKEEIISILEEQVTALDPSRTHSLLADVIVKASSVKTKNRFVKLYFELLSQSPKTIYNDALKCVLNCYGENDHFKLPDFDTQLVGFVRETMHLEEAEKCLLPLFLQSHNAVIKTVIEQALLRGSEGIDILKILRQVPEACIYNDAMVNELCFYFSKDVWETHVEKNMENLLKSLMEIQVETDIISFDTFLEKCILPALETRGNKFDLVLDCLNVSLSILVNNEALKLNSDSISNLWKLALTVLNNCIVSSNGKRKGKILTVLSSLKKYLQNTNKLSDEFKACCLQDLESCDPIVDLYTVEFTGREDKDILESKEVSLSTLWSWCCHFKDIKPLKDYICVNAISYKQIVKALGLVHHHFTKEEWIESANLIVEYFKECEFKGLSLNMSWLLPQSDPQLYSVIRCLLDVYEFCIEKYTLDSYFISSCFASTVMNLLLPHQVHPHLFINVYIDISHLISSSEDEILTFLVPFLRNIQKMLSEACKDKQQLENFSQLLSCCSVKLSDPNE